MIRRVTGSQLVHVVLSHHERGIVEIKASQIFRVENAMAKKSIDTYLGRASFMELQEDYPMHIELTPTSIRIKSPKTLNKKLEEALRFARDKRIEDAIWESWEQKE